MKKARFLGEAGGGRGGEGRGVRGEHIGLPH